MTQRHSVTSNTWKRTALSGLSCGLYTLVSGTQALAINPEDPR